MHPRGQRVARRHLHPDDIDRNPARDDVRRKRLDQARVTGLAVGHDEQAVGAVAELFFASLQQRVRTAFHVLAKRRAAALSDAVDRPGQHGLLARAKRINPVAPGKHQDADVCRVRHLVEHLLEGLLGHGHSVPPRTGHVRAHRAGSVDHHHHVVGHLHLRLAKRRGPEADQHHPKPSAHSI